MSLRSDSSTTIAPTPRRRGSFEGDLEKNVKTVDDEQVNPLLNYVVPVLPKDVKTALSAPPSKWTQFRIWYNPYRQFFTLALTLNAVGILLAALGKFPYAQKRAAAVSLGNVLAAVVFRNELLLRGLFWVLVKLFQKWTPLTFRIFLTAVLQHVGGIHSGCAVSSLFWLIYTVCGLFINHSFNHPVVLAFGVVTALTISISILSAFPIVRERHHNAFEHHHRFAGWAGLAFVWILVVTSDLQDPKNPGHFSDYGRALVVAQEFWFAVAITILIFVPWATARKVPVEITLPSTRVAIIKFERGIQQGLLGRVSRHGLLEYHGFGIISEGIESSCHYMICGVQGDWTRSIVERPPKMLWTREMKFAGLPYLAHLYRRGICLCTGSGIGAVLSTCVQLDNWFLIWIGSDLQNTFGPVLFDMIERRIPKERHILFDTKKEGRRPDTMKMLKDIYEAFNAEVVIITSNPKGNAELMQGCKENGMHSFGPLWDS